MHARSTYAGITFDNIRPVIKTKKIDDLLETDVILKQLEENFGIDLSLSVEEESSEEERKQDEEDSALYNQLKF